MLSEFLILITVESLEALGEILSVVVRSGVTVFFLIYIFGEVWLCHAYMMFHFQGPSRHCSLLAVLSGKSRDSKQKQKQDAAAASEEDQSSYPFPELSSFGCLEVTVTEFLLV